MLIEHLETVDQVHYRLIRKVTNLTLIVPMRRLSGLLHIIKAKVLRRLAIWVWKQDDTITANRPRPIHSVLFVCKGNICRSPLAEAYMKSKLTGKHQLRVFSAGLDTTPGHTANSVAETIARQYGLALEGHRTTPISRELIRQADLIVVMEYSQRQSLLATYPEAHGKVSLLSSFRSGLVTHIPDPYGGTHEQFDHCYQLISHSCDNLLTYIIGLHNSSPHRNSSQSRKLENNKTDHWASTRMA